MIPLGSRIVIEGDEGVLQERVYYLDGGYWYRVLFPPRGLPWYRSRLMHARELADAAPPITYDVGERVALYGGQRGVIEARHAAPDGTFVYSIRLPDRRFGAAQDVHQPGGTVSVPGHLIERRISHD